MQNSFISLTRNILQLPIHNTNLSHPKLQLLLCHENHHTASKNNIPFPPQPPPVPLSLGRGVEELEQYRLAIAFHPYIYPPAASGEHHMPSRAAQCPPPPTQPRPNAQHFFLISIVCSSPGSSGPTAPRAAPHLPIQRLQRAQRSLLRPHQRRAGTDAGIFQAFSAFLVLRRMFPAFFTPGDVLQLALWQRTLWGHPAVSRSLILREVCGATE
ncbi:hypothetical protein CEXT_667871 [Caerostris extrusa]|uniref:Uncharacterized protein n=1 Tax=Caerostris extrusa TaxID=172846 RepID=A0AAV4SG18_CAEEX|nr:hypothetical protein CEXT_667871 [Caerostris extrusa]